MDMDKVRLNQQATIRDKLARKDNESVAESVPKGFAIIAAKKKEFLFLQQQEIRYEARTTASCIPHCMKMFESPVVTQSESDCLNNCSAKANEVLMHAQLLNAKATNYAL